MSCFIKYYVNHWIFAVFSVYILWKVYDNTTPLLPWWLSWWRICLQCGRPEFDPLVGKIPWRREQRPTPVFWPGEFHGLFHGVTKNWTRLSNFYFHFHHFPCPILCPLSFRGVFVLCSSYSLHCTEEVGYRSLSAETQSCSPAIS